jgi:hypothetical protein
MAAAQVNGRSDFGEIALAGCFATGFVLLAPPPATLIRPVKNWFPSCQVSLTFLRFGADIFNFLWRKCNLSVNKVTWFALFDDAFCHW